MQDDHEYAVRILCEGRVTGYISDMKGGTQRRRIHALRFTRDEADAIARGIQLDPKDQRVAMVARVFPKAGGVE